MSNNLQLVFLFTLFIAASCGGRGGNIEKMELKINLSDENRTPIKSIKGQFCLRLQFENKAEGDTDEVCKDVESSRRSGNIKVSLDSKFAQKMRIEYDNQDLMVLGSELFLRVEGKHFKDGTTREFVADIIDSELKGEQGVVHGWADLDILIPKEIYMDYKDL